jgi:two-component system alkaline phosphatase synthesis response regulator PhoP
MSTILVIEDEQAISEVVVEILEDAQHTTMAASNGREGLALIAEQRPDLIICDVMMPILDGRGFCEAIRAEPVYSTIPVIMMSAGTFLSADEYRYDAFIYKPFDLDNFLIVVNKVLQRHAS